ncbi:unnamed protein product [Leptosia nina]|uniref:Uncharacterized protein n=1 Tax=Leptosia nina TaxID=320188 RepID=A0AAV1IZV2_9NEOP
MNRVCQTIPEVEEPRGDSTQPTSYPYKKKDPSKRMRLIFNALGIVIAVLATYMIVSTDSKLYVIFWLCYSVLRRLMVKSRSHLKTE